MNGRPAKLYEADGILRAVLLPEGESKVEFCYLPLAFYMGITISSLTILSVAGYATCKRKFRN